ncbi:MAG: methylmalonyl Co-A mutase-associated GTPase MeaB [Cyclobacteriaceae bacterium]|nr:methylmalonyl Co-A mutase-associated GTPase MeaB [Cyclobacteriaceae bacterium]
MSYVRKKRLPVDSYVDGILSGNRILLSKAITLVESALPEDNALAEEVLSKVIPYTGRSYRIGITGVPGVGKSTFIDSFGKYVTSLNRKLAVLTIDPSSKRSKGAILGDKTRMEALSVDPLAFIRPSASGSALGGVAQKTRETMFLCEAAGYEVVFIETVGVGQSEITVNEMVDFFLLLMLAGAGDELQGIKKGIMEMADSIVITKADGENIKKAERARIEYQNALHLFPPNPAGWYPKVTTCSALEETGIREIWDIIEEHHQLFQEKGMFAEKRKLQNVAWMHHLIVEIVTQRFYRKEAVRKIIPEIEKKVATGQIPAIKAARDLMQIHDQPGKGNIDP